MKKEDILHEIDTRVLDRSREVEDNIEQTRRGDGFLVLHLRRGPQKLGGGG